MEISIGKHKFILFITASEMLKYISLYNQGKNTFNKM